MQGLVAILGGTFDPVHLGHLHIATEILKLRAAESVLFAPSGNHHFKQNSILLPFEQRYALVEKAIMCNSNFAITDADKSGSGYTADLMKKMFYLHPEVNFTFIIGSDNLLNLHKWYNYPYLQQYVSFIILPRPGYPLLPQVINQLKATVLDIPLCPISATDIRRRIFNGESIKGMVPADLEEDIIALYQNKKPTNQDN